MDSLGTSRVKSHNTDKYEVTFVPTKGRIEKRIFQLAPMPYTEALVEIRKLVGWTLEGVTNFWVTYKNGKVPK